MKFDGAGNCLNLGGSDGAGAVDHHGSLARIEDGGFDAVRGGTGVENGVDAAVEVVEHVGGGGGAGVAEEVGAGGGYREPRPGVISSKATGCAGMRMPTRGRPAVTASGTAAERGKSSVSGPGQKAADELRAARGDAR